MLTTFASSKIHVSIAAEEVFSIAGFPITNSMILGGLGILVMLMVFLHVTRQLKRGGKKSSLTKLTQWAVEGMYKNIFDIIDDKKIARSIAPLALTIFFTVLFTYWISVLPGVGTITYNGVLLFRGLPADLNFTFALAIITIVAVQFYAIRQHGFFGNIGRYAINPFKNPVGAVEGALEFVGEFSRMISLSFRLFGNALAGEVLLIVAIVLANYVSPTFLPALIIFELFIGFIQAYVFYVLTLIFASLAVAGHGSHEDEKTATPENVRSLDDLKTSQAQR